MADLTANAALAWMGEKFTERWILDNSAAQTIYKGQPMILDVSADTVYVRGFIDATVVAADDIFIGIAAEGATVATTDTEIDNEIEIYVYPSIVGIRGATFDDSDVGDTMYMSDSATLSATAADNPILGKLKRVKGGYQYIILSSPTVCAGA